ncbi:hypothetical protein [Moorena producens]|uniref:hypothetical protein n=1 Tax=Moorena producens TaxID=1155739 RepID=UPI0011EA6450|nr:hypothetical protein [Moorena producens]
MNISGISPRTLRTCLPRRLFQVRNPWAFRPHQRNENLCSLFPIPYSQISLMHYIRVLDI